MWTVTKVYVDQAWNSSSNPDDDFAFLRISQPGSSVPIEDVTGAEKLATGTPASRQLVQVIGYPDSTNQAVTCQNWLREPMADQLEFDCGGYTDGTSGGPVPERGRPGDRAGPVIGVIGGYEQGGYTPQVSYSAVLGANAAALYKQAGPRWPGSGLRARRRRDDRVDLGQLGRGRGPLRGGRVGLDLLGVRRSGDHRRAARLGGQGADRGLQDRDAVRLAPRR